jgi:transcriptional regulator with XRE-family HTH domain
LNARVNVPGFVREIRKRTGLTREKSAARLGVAFPTFFRVLRVFRG